MLSRVLKYSFASDAKYKVVFLRHGESLWNKENRFTGWTDVRLSSNGIQEAINAGKALRQNGYEFDICYTSVLTRAIQTFNYAADEIDCHYIPVIKNWRLNERHYGALQGLNKLETVEKHGKEQVQIWRRSYDIPPPELELSDERHPLKDKRYKDLDQSLLPKTESLKTTIDRVLPYWNDTIVPKIKSGSKVLVVAHGNSLRAIVKILSNVSDKDITELNIPTSIPLIYEFDENFKVLKYQYLADPEEL